jgi:hypothetical protein
MVDASERLHILLSQEKIIYQTSDYLTRMHSQAQYHHATSAMDTSNKCSPSSSPSTSPKKRKSYDDDVNVVDQPSRATHNSAGDDEGSSTQINKHWREKICEWAYQGKYTSQYKAMIMNQ